MLLSKTKCEENTTQIHSNRIESHFLLHRVKWKVTISIIDCLPQDWLINHHGDMFCLNHQSSVPCIKAGFIAIYDVFFQLNCNCTITRPSWCFLSNFTVYILLNPHLYEKLTTPGKRKKKMVNLTNMLSVYCTHLSVINYVFKSLDDTYPPHYVSTSQKKIDPYGKYLFHSVWKNE